MKPYFILTSTRKCLSYNIARHFHLNNYKCCDVRVRFAPSPTGSIHLGGLRTALFNYAYAKSHYNGKFILRIEDTDQKRLVPGVADNIEDILRWAKLIPDESPNLGGPAGPYTQSQRIKIYQNCAQELLNSGSAYKCFCSDIRLKLLRKEQLKNKQKSMYDGNCRNLSNQQIQELERQNTPFTIRLKLKSLPSFIDMVFGEHKIDSSMVEGDPILMKSDGFPTYNFANVVDDHFMNITHVLRGEELLVSTPKHLFIYEAFGWQPPTFGHLPLLKGPDGAKLSKRHGSLDVQMFKDQGYSPEAVLNFISYSGGAFQRRDNEFQSFPMDKLIEKFEISCMKTNRAVVELKQLPVFSRNYILYCLSDSQLRIQLFAECRELLSHKYGNNRIDGISDELLGYILEWDELSISYPKQLLEDQFTYLWQDDCLSSYNLNNSEIIIKEFIHLLQTTTVLDAKSLFYNVEKIRGANNANKKEFYSFLRQTLTNKVNGPPLLKIIEMLGKERILKKLLLAEANIN